MKIVSKLTSRKFWMALAAFVVGVMALFQVNGNITTQISGVIMSLGSVVAYIVGEGLVDASAAGTAAQGSGSVPQYTGQEIGTVPNTAPTNIDQTATADAAQVKQDTALSEGSAPTAENIVKAMVGLLQQTQSVPKSSTDNSTAQ